MERRTTKNAAWICYLGTPETRIAEQLLRNVGLEDVDITSISFEIDQHSKRVPQGRGTLYRAMKDAGRKSKSYKEESGFLDEFSQIYVADDRLPETERKIAAEVIDFMRMVRNMHNRNDVKFVEVIDGDRKTIWAYFHDSVLEKELKSYYRGTEIQVREADPEIASRSEYFASDGYRVWVRGRNPGERVGKFNAAFNLGQLEGDVQAAEAEIKERVQTDLKEEIGTHFEHLRKLKWQLETPIEVVGPAIFGDSVAILVRENQSQAARETYKSLLNKLSEYGRIVADDPQAIEEMRKNIDNHRDVFKEKTAELWETLKGKESADLEKSGD